MRKIILELITSLDGFIEGANGEIDWIPFDEEAANYLNGFADEVDSIFYGRVSYEMYGSYENPETTIADESSFWTKIKTKKKFVFTSNSEKNFEGAVTISRNLEKEVKRIKNEPGKNIWLFGGASLIASFVQLNLVDEYRISIAPVLIGDGKPLFLRHNNRIPLKLIRTYSSKSGVISNHYEVVR